MNVLLFVTTMIMVLSIMTYARIESFRDLSGLMSQFEWYMEKHERRFANAAVDQKYNEENPVKKKSGIDPDAKQESEEKACSKLSLYLLFNKKQREIRQEIFGQHYRIAKILIERLYGNAQFFRQAEETRPDLIEQILDGMIEASENHSVESAADMASLDLKNVQLNEVLYRILKGTVEIEGQDEKKTYPSLFKYITVKSKTKIRIYLAPKGLLLTIYDDPDLVSEIIKKRKDLYRQVKDEDLTLNEASKEFANEFSGKQQIEIDDSILDFRVSKTNPRGYE